MNEFDNISDEQLACLIEDTLSEKDRDCILDAVACDGDMDVLSIAYHASKLVDTDASTSTKINDLPHWNSEILVSCTPTSTLYQPMRECAFLGDADISVDVCIDEIEDFDDDIASCIPILNEEEGKD